MKTDKIGDFMGEPYNIHVCDFCGEACEDGRGWRYLEEKDITICQWCICKYADEFGYKPDRHITITSPGKAPIPEDLRWKVYQRDGYACKNCGSMVSLTIDHIIPESKGGTTTEENLQTLCKKCNIKKGAKFGT
jgi:ribosomal protein L24E